MKTKKEQNMKTWLMSLGMLSVISLFGIGCQQEQTESNENTSAVVPEQNSTPQNFEKKGGFHTVSSQLDANADFIVYWNATKTTEALNNGINNAAEFGMDIGRKMGVSEDELEEGRTAIEFVAKAFKKTGITQVKGLAFSNVQIDENLARSKVIIQREQGNDGPTLWDLFGQPQSVKSHFDQFPASTVIANSGQINLAECFQIVTDFVNKNAPDEAIQDYQNQLAMLNQQFPIEDLIKSFKGSYLLGVKLNEEKPFAYPTPGGAVELPEPSLAMVLNVTDSTLFGLVKSSFGQAPLEPYEVEGGEGFSVKLPLPIPLDFQPTFIQSGDKFIVASNTSYATEMLNPSAAPGGVLSESEELQKWINQFEGDANSVTFVSNNVSGLVTTLTESVLAMTNEFASDVEMNLIKENFVNNLKDIQYSGITRIDKNGLYTESYSNIPDLYTKLMGPTAIGSSMFLPALSKAKAKASSIKCINNLKQLSLAIKMYASENDNQLPSDISQIIEYIGEPRVCNCPDDPNQIDPSLSFDDDEWKEFNSYKFNFKEGVKDTNDANTVLIECPFHGHKAMGDGSVIAGPDH